MEKKKRLKASEVWGDVKRTCNTCSNQMDYVTDFAVGVCVNPGCPSYGLLAVSAENMLLKEKRKQ